MNIEMIWVFRVVALRCSVGENRFGGLQDCTGLREKG